MVQPPGAHHALHAALDVQGKLEREPERECAAAEGVLVQQPLEELVKGVVGRPDRLQPLDAVQELLWEGGEPAIVLLARGEGSEHGVHALAEHASFCGSCASPAECTR